MTDFTRVMEIATNDVHVLRNKDAEYGSSWQKRGGVGAFMMLARKWDRLETQCKEHGWDIFKACEDATKMEVALDTLADLRRYLLLVEEHVTAQWEQPPLHQNEPELPREYVNPDLP